MKNAYGLNTKTNEYFIFLYTLTNPKSYTVFKQKNHRKCMFFSDVNKTPEIYDFYML